MSPAPSNQPSTCALRTIDLVGRAANHADAVDGLQAAIGLRLQIDARAHLVVRAGLRGAIEDRFEEQPVAAADVEAGIAAVAEVARQLVAGQANEIEHADRAALDQLLGARIHRAALEQHVALRHDQLHGDLALDVDVLQHRGTGGADVDERRGHRAALDRRRRRPAAPIRGRCRSSRRRRRDRRAASPSTTAAATATTSRPARSAAS